MPSRGSFRRARSQFARISPRRRTAIPGPTKGPWEGMEVGNRVVALVLVHVDHHPVERAKTRHALDNSRARHPASRTTPQLPALAVTYDVHPVQQLYLRLQPRSAVQTITTHIAWPRWKRESCEACCWHRSAGHRQRRRLQEIRDPAASPSCASLRAGQIPGRNESCHPR